jgi:hypothetical protein
MVLECYVIQALHMSIPDHHVGPVSLHATGLGACCLSEPYQRQGRIEMGGFRCRVDCPSSLAGLTATTRLRISRSIPSESGRHRSEEHVLP